MSGEEEDKEVGQGRLAQAFLDLAFLLLTDYLRQEDHPGDLLFLTEATPLPSDVADNTVGLGLDLT